jgi:hypothetical protein
MTQPNMVDPDLIKQLVREIANTRPDCVDCPHCYEQLDHYAELILSGHDAATIMPDLHEHLQGCTCCSEEFEALLEALRPHE